MNKISLVVLNYNGRALLKDYFESLFCQTQMPDEIIFVDNNSSDKSASFVKTNYPLVKIVVNSKNHGTAKGSNIGFKYTSGDYIVFQSNDIIMDKNCIKELTFFLDKNPKAGICSSVLLQKKTNLIDNAGGVVDALGYPMQKYPNIEVNQIPASGEVFFSYGGSFIIRRNVFEKTNGFDERFFTLNDDVDLSWRVRLLGFGVFYTKKSIVWHIGSATLGKIFERSEKHYWSERNLLRAFIKNSETQKLIMFFPLCLLLLFAEMAYMLYRLKFNLFVSIFKAILWNVFYIPETLRLRLSIQKDKMVKISNDLFIKTSFKLRLFRAFSSAL